jgi:transposase-like protein
MSNSPCQQLFSPQLSHFCVETYSHAKIPPMSAAETKTLEARAQEYRDYPKDLKASVIQAIDANGSNVLATARLFNIPPQTVDYWYRHSNRFSQVQKPSGINLADKLENLANSTADSMAEHDLSIVTYADKARALSVVIDKMQLLRGNPTQIVEQLESKELLVVLAEALSMELGDAGSAGDQSDPDRLLLNGQTVDVNP